MKKYRIEKIKVNGHKRYDPRSGKQVDVSSYDRNQRFKQYKNNPNKDLRSSRPKGLTADNISYIQYKILEQIKLNAYYGEETTMDDLYDELTFSEEDENRIRGMVENLRSQGLLNKKNFTPTKEGNRIFWEFYNEYEDSEDLELLKDYPNHYKRRYWTKEGKEILSEHKKSNPGINKNVSKSEDKINNDQWQILEYIHYNSGVKKPMDLNVPKISDWLDIDEKEVKNAIRDLRDKEILSPKELKITNAGMRIKESYERKYDPSP